MPFPTHILKVDRRLSADEAEHLSRTWDAVIRTGKTPVIGTGITWDRLPDNPHAIADGMLPAYCRFTATEAAS